MNLTQKRMATTADFQFGEQSLEYAVQDNSGRVEFEVDYANIPHNRRQVYERNNWLRNVGLIWCVIGVIQIGLALTSRGSLSGSGFWLIIGLGCLAFYRLTWSAYSVFDTPEGSIWVIQDKQHDAIVSALHEKRKGRLLSLYGRLDLDNDPEREVQKIEWLAKEKALSRDEADKQIAEVRGARALPPPETERKLH